MTYNNPISDPFGRAASPASFAMGPAPSRTPVPQAPAPVGASSSNSDTALVRVLFIPTLPDELSITVGEVVRVIKAFDDGWALCANVRGDQGVVPLECLDRNANVTFGQQESGGDWRNMKRISSLVQQQQPVRY